MLHVMKVLTHSNTNVIVVRNICRRATNRCVRRVCRRVCFTDTAGAEHACHRARTHSFVTSGLIIFYVHLWFRRETETQREFFSVFTWAHQRSCANTTELAYEPSSGRRALTFETGNLPIAVARARLVCCGLLFGLSLFVSNWLASDWQTTLRAGTQRTSYNTDN